MNPSQRAWSKSEHKRLRALYPKTPTPEIALAFGRTRKAVSSRAKVLGLRKAVGHGGHSPWSAKQENLLRTLFPHISTEKTAKRVGHSLTATSQWAHKLGLRKTQKYLDSPDACRLRRGDNPGIPYRYPKGHVPANKGTRRPGWAPGRMASTQFKKGQRSGQAALNVKPLWSFRWCDGYLMLKTGADTPLPTRGWEYVHKLIWEQAKGPLPDWREARLWWKDGDHGNCSLANLELVPSAEHVRRTTIHRLPKELVQVIQLTGALKRKIRNREKKQIEKHDGRSAESPVRCA